eukprot:CAMPEP_0202908198 /NCGR_PEP_ID=MMETSP1392-20130828/45228_1 /ASSEMBLY_ACC=CAM_ASM_000868 /TAXON_ID=225041 /ORGANISM="Chlamydomonas chlamydogama, Strain SAG 11-48b" /LENGTH=72 /DNA_ID=CAMNT_0049597403 /DNA_START=44 /DNA_END=259 /DNA_ORIENTATION=+
MSGSLRLPSSLRAGSKGLSQSSSQRLSNGRVCGAPSRKTLAKSKGNQADGLGAELSEQQAELQRLIDENNKL